MTDIKQLLDGAERILITSHTSPDPDAVASVLLLGTTLQKNYPDKEVQMVLEEKPDRLDFLTGYDTIQFKPLLEASEALKPDLFMMVDANNYERASRHDGVKVRAYLKQIDTKLVIIDHHLPDDKDDAEVYINSGNPAAAQEVYEICFDNLGLKKPEGYAQTTMAGLYSDSGGFAYANPRHQQTFKLASELVEAGANIERLKNQLNQYSEDQMSVLNELMSNLNHGDDHTYTFINDAFVEDWTASKRPLITLQSVRKRFVSEYIRNVDGRQWGFVISLDPLEGPNYYSVSFRSVDGAKDVAKIAQQFGGGGHKSASGADLKAENVQDAIAKVKAAIAQTD